MATFSSKPCPASKKPRADVDMIEEDVIEIEEVTPVDASCPLFMECEDEPLSEAQKLAKEYQEETFKAQMTKLEAMAKAGATVTYNQDGSVCFRVTERQLIRPIVPSPQVSQIQQIRPLNPPTRINAGALQLLRCTSTGRVVGTLNNGLATLRPPRAYLRPMNSPRQIIPLSLPTRPIPPQNIRLVSSSLQAQPTPTTASSLPTHASVIDLTETETVASPKTTSSGPLVKAKEPKSGFVSLYVHPKAIKTVANPEAKRTELDKKVRRLLALPSKELTEWLMQQNLILNKMYQGKNSKIELKLGIHQNSGQMFSNSGGYVWVSTNGKVTSVLKHSIFDATTTSPVTILKLIYHWACHTSIQNVKQWVKVDETVIYNFYRIFRATCVTTIHSDVGKLGGAGKLVELGLISLGSTLDGNRKEIRVEIYGALDRETGHFRLRAAPPRVVESQKQRFLNILISLSQLVHPDSLLVVDSSVDRSIFMTLGFRNVIDPNANSTMGTNEKIMNLLKTNVPNMFQHQNALSHLTLKEIQILLDELTFRELFAHYPLLCFDTIIQKIGKATLEAQEMDENVTVASRSNQIITNPFYNYSAAQTRVNLKI